MHHSITTHRETALCRTAVGSLALVVAFAAAASAERVTIRAQAVPQSTVVRLGDVADVRGADGQPVERLASLPLMPAPAPGTRRYLRMREVQDLLAAHGEDLRRLQFNGQTVVEVQAPSLSDRSAEPNAEVAPPAEPRPEPLTTDQISQIREQVRSAIVRHVQAASRSSDPWQVKFDLPEQHLQLLRTAVRPPLCEGGSSPWAGPQQFVLYFATAGGNARLAVPAEVSLPLQYAFAIRPISRGDVITAADVELRFVDTPPTTNARRAPLDDLEQLIGQVAGRSIQADDVVFSDDIHAPLLVRRGETITVVARGGGIRVRTQARAREDGAQGDLVQVESLETRERYDAQVIGDREAAVFAGTPMRTSPSTARRAPPEWR